MYTLSSQVWYPASVYLARVARHAAVEAGEGAGWAAQPRGEDAAHRAGQRQPRADVACSAHTKIFYKYKNISIFQLTKSLAAHPILIHV